MELLKLNRSMPGSGPGPGASLCRPAPPLLNSSGTGNLSCELPRGRGNGTRGVSVSVSTLSLVAIALERYSAICRPLQARVWQTRSHAARVIVATWMLSGLLMVPYPVYTVVQPVGPRALQCMHRWPSARVRQTWSVLLLLLLFFIPGVVMAVAYGLISRELYLGLRFDGESDSESQSQVRSQGGLPGAALPNGRCRTDTRLAGEDGDGCYVQLPRSRPALELSALTAPTAGPGSGHRPTQAKLLAKKRVVRMLLVIVVLFFMCWLPVYSANTWRAFDDPGARRALSGAPISFIHLLSYASACVNPLVYCFMHRRFRQACLDTCARCCPRPPRARPRPLPEEDPPTPSIASLSRLSYTTVSTLGPG
ncbi:cholecystokinin B receptor [Phyllostomus discolor]|uniref:Gastrin/cholecystokinin type B receptor n=1 Tax=Phyllostomus discolor TaxID=89673 RepID=A0A6J2M002_9CHIR|nr:gastrin/cholecystokinin type B receptor isoform X3 [Phyllostomus discolor]KAF6102558.1 cholecystokinin B receptor [Phyllostomus discolor]